MSCTPNYIHRALENVSDEQRIILTKDYTEKHTAFGRDALKEDFFSTNKATNPTNKAIVGSRIYAGTVGKKRLSDAIKWVEDRNSREGEEIFSIVEDPNYPGRDARYLKLNLLPLIKKSLQAIDEESAITDVDSLDDLLVFSLQKSKLLDEIDYVNSFEATVEKIEEAADYEFKKTVTDFVSNLKNNILPKLKDGDFYKGKSKDSLGKLIFLFEKNEDSIGYIYKTYLTHGLKRVNELSDIIKKLQERTSQLKQLEGEIYKDELNSLLTEYKQLTLYMNFFNVMDEFKTELDKTQLNFPYWSVFKRTKLEDSVEEDLRDFLASNNVEINEDELVDLIAEGFKQTNDLRDLIDFYKEQLEQKFPESRFSFSLLEKALKESIQNSRLVVNGKPVEDPINTQLTKALSTIEIAKKDLIRLNKTLVMEQMVLPATLKSYQEYYRKKTGEELTELPENIGKKTDLQKKHNIPSKSELYDWFNVTDKGISDVDKWWGSISTMSDPILQSIVNRFRTELLELDFKKKQDFISMSEEYKELSDIDKEKVNTEFTREVVILQTDSQNKIQEVTGKETDDEKKKYVELEVEIAGQIFKYKGLKALHLVSDNAYAEFADTKTIFFDQLNKGVFQAPFIEAIRNKDYEQVKTLLETPQYQSLYNDFFTTTGAFKVNDFKNLDRVKELIKKSFYQYNYKQTTEEEKAALQNELGWLDILEGNLAQGQKEKLIAKNIAPNVRSSEIRYNDKGVMNLVNFKDLAVKIGDRYLVQTKTDYKLIPLDGDFSEAVNFFFYTGKFSQLADKWKTFSQENSTKFNQLEGKKLAYYNKLRENFHQANLNYNGEGSKHLRLPSVLRKDRDEGIVEKIKRYKDPSQIWEDIKDGFVYNDSEYQGNEGLIKPKYVRKTNIENIEKDLFTNLMTYSNAALDYKYKTKLDNEAFIITQKFAGDSSIGITQRQEFYKKAGKGGEVRLAKNHLEIWTNFINTNIKEVQQEAKVNVFGTQIDLNKVSKRLKGLTNYGALAWNFSTAIPNFAIGQINNFGYAAAQSFATEKEWKEAAQEYFGISSGLGFARSAKDMLAINESNKSKIGQLFNYFGGVSGEIDLDKMSNKSLANRFKVGELLYFTTSAPEHAIQSTALIMLMKSYKLESGKSLWDAVQYTEGENISFEATQEEINDFRNKFEKIKMQLHGNYSNLDKTTWQSSWYLSFALMFKKWIYESVRSRYGKEYYDFTLEQDVEGFHYKFLKQMFRDFKDLEKGAMPKIQAFLKGAGRTLGATLNTLSFRQLEKNEQFKEFVYGDEDVAAYVRATFEISMFLGLGVVAAGLHALNDEDDEEERNIVLQNLEYAASRIQRDLGFLLPYVNVPFMPEGSVGSGFFVMTDNIAKLYKDPFTMGRTSSAYTKTLAQLFENPREEYTRSGYGYEKGDNKLIDDLQKTAVAPLFQISKLMNPQEQLSFMNVIYSNSTTDTKTESK